MTPKQISLRIHEDAPWESPNVYHRDYTFKNIFATKNIQSQKQKIRKPTKTSLSYSKREGTEK
jgi:hypothetical protein